MQPWALVIDELCHSNISVLDDLNYYLKFDMITCKTIRFSGNGLAPIASAEASLEMAPVGAYTIGTPHFQITSE